MNEKVIENAKRWLTDEYDAQTRAEVEQMLKGDPKALEFAFYKSLEFGTGGLRGFMGAGTNRMNKYTVGMATQGFANYLKISFPDLEQIKVAISYDCRNNSSAFARIVAEIFEANGFKVFLTKELRPTPELSYAIRYYGCQGGVMLTASHNPKEYNGYKAYWSDGAQVIAPHDVNIIAEVNKITSPSQVLFTKPQGCKGEIVMVGEELDDAYLKDILTLLVSRECVEKHPDVCVVYTPLHGCGVKMVPRALKLLGMTNVHLVEEQCVNDGNFPTVESPNPENPPAMKMALDLAYKVGAEVVLASDPDADRMGMGLRRPDGEIQLLNGNQTLCLLTYYMLTRWSQKGLLKNRADGKFPYIVKTIVTSNLMTAIARKFDVPCYNVLTGFKNIAEVVKYNEGKGIYICGGEESFGFAVGEFVRDKDSVITCSIACECAAWCACNGMTMWDFLQSMYAEFGTYETWLTQYVFPGIEGKQKIDGLVEQFRNNPPKEIAGMPVVEYRDYLKNDYYAPDVLLAKSNVLQYITAEGTMASLRPSGTEPKIKFYFEVRASDPKEKEAKVAALKKQFAIE